MELTDLPQLYSRIIDWNHVRAVCFCSAEDDVTDLRASLKTRLVKEKTDRYGSCKETFRRRAAALQGRLTKQMIYIAAFFSKGVFRDALKALLWEEDGFLLMYKRLDNGGFQWPRSESEVRLLTQEQYVWLMQGLSTEQPKAIQKSKKYTDII